MARRLVKILVAQTAAGRLLGKLPLVQSSYRGYVWRGRQPHHSLFGVYNSYAEAVADVPADRSPDWDIEDISAEGLRQPSMYASLFWLRELMAEASHVVDLGGSVGNLFYDLRERSRLPAGLSWHIVEVPALLARGREIAAEKGALEISFGSSLAEVKRCDILFSAGCLPYLERSVPGLLEEIGARPQHILLNKLPLTSGPSFHTLQHLGPTISPYRIYNETAFIDYFMKAGYAIRDRWSVAELSAEIPFHPERRLSAYTGLLFTRQS